MSLSCHQQPKKRGYELRPGEPGDNVGNTTYFCCLSAHKLPATTPSISSGGNILLAFFLSSPITWLVFFTFVDVRTTWVYRPPHSGINNLQYKLISLEYSYSRVWISPFNDLRMESILQKNEIALVSNQKERHLEHQIRQRCTYLVKVGLIFVYLALLQSENQPNLFWFCSHSGKNI